MRPLVPFNFGVAAIVALAAVNGWAGAQTDAPPLSAGQVAQALKGKTCTTKAGAHFTFTSDGHYAYEGTLGFAHTGHYRFTDGAVSVMLDSGLGRDFAISRRDDILYIEQTAIRCETDRKDVRFSAPR